MSTKIEWTNETWNPIIGCSKISPGCDNCYAEKMANRLASNPKIKESYCNVIEGGKWNGKTHLVQSAIEKPLRMKKPRMIFVCSMGDLFHESVPFEWIDMILDVIYRCKQHTFQILTKRPDRMLAYWKQCYNESGLSFQDTTPKEDTNIWWGVTAENQEQYEKRVPILLEIPAKIRFISVEPMLSPIFLTQVDTKNSLDWVICGGESGHSARPLPPHWADLLRVDCEHKKIPFFFKQWGEYTYVEPKDVKKYPSSKILIQKSIGKFFAKVGKKKAGNLLNGKVYNEMPKIN